MDKMDAAQLSDDEVAQRRDAIVRVMANMLPQPRTTKQPLKARRKAMPTASDRKAASIAAVRS